MTLFYRMSIIFRAIADERATSRAFIAWTVRLTDCRCGSDAGTIGKPFKETVVRMTAIALVSGLLLTPLGGCAYSQSIGTEAEMHPRIAQAIRDLEDAVAYMQAAPDNFGGHKAAAIAASQAAIQELHAALAFRAQQDGHY